MEILTVTMAEGSGRSGTTGTTVGFLSKENIKLGSYVSMKVPLTTNTVTFEVIETSTGGLDFLNIRAKQADFRFDGLHEKQGFDPRSILGCSVELITSEEVLKDIKKREGYC